MVFHCTTSISYRIMSNTASSSMRGQWPATASDSDTTPIPNPSTKVAYDTPSFQTFQDRKRLKLLAKLEAGGYVPPARLKRGSEYEQQAVSTLTETSPLHDEVTHQSAHQLLPATPEQSSSLLRHVQYQPDLLARSDTITSVRSLDRQMTSASRPLPKPPATVTASRSLDRGPAQAHEAKTIPTFKLDGVEENSVLTPVESAVAHTHVSPVVPRIVCDDARSLVVAEHGQEDTDARRQKGGVCYTNLPVIVTSSDERPRTSSSTVTDHVIVCAGCEGSIIGRTVSAMSKHYHPECFRCAECGEHLEHVSSYEWEGRAYCHLDYHDVSGAYNLLAYLTICRNSPIDVTIVERPSLNRDLSPCKTMYWANAIITSSTSSVANAVTLFSIPVPHPRLGQRAKPKRRVPSSYKRATLIASDAI